MNSSPKQSTEQTVTKKDSTKGPLDATAPLFSDIWGKTQGAIDSPLPQSFVAGPTPAQVAAANNMIGLAPGLDSNANTLRDMAGKVAGGYFLDPTNDPTFAGAASAAINPITRQLTEKVLPQITDASIRNGGVGGGPSAYGGPRQDIQENQALKDWEAGAGDITSKLAATSRGQGMDLMKSAPQFDAAATSSALMPSQVMGTAGTQQQSWAQGGLQDIIQKWLFPLTGLQQAAGIGTAGGYYSGSENSDSMLTKTTPAPDLSTQWLQGITGGLGMATSIAGLPGMSSIGSWLSGLGGTGGATGSLGFALPNQRY